MSAKPESTFIRGVHDKFVKAPHYEKMHNPYRGGTWDVWYSGLLGDLWIEYKWMKKYPLRGIIHPDLSPLQKNWGWARHQEGRNLAVVIGTPAGGVLLENPMHWLNGVHVSVCRNHFTRSKQELACWVLSKTGVSGDSSKSSFSCEDRRIVL